ncbi:hypothetical protein [Streptomyces eurythermus]|uniref:hypothetical protein n=1 Tax=Streptomyces eurythermus TaxID=42237 RepID=UPI00340A1859
MRYGVRLSPLRRAAARPPPPGPLRRALPALWPLLAPLTGDMAPGPHWYGTTAALSAWLPALALCAAHHRDAPPGHRGWCSWPGVW